MLEGSWQRGIQYQLLDLFTLLQKIFHIFGVGLLKDAVDLGVKPIFQIKVATCAGSNGKSRWNVDARQRASLAQVRHFFSG